MPASAQDDPDHIADEARAWAGLFLAGEPTPADLARFDVWRARSPHHATAFAAAQEALALLGGSNRLEAWIAEVQSAAPGETTRPQVATRRGWIFGGLAAAAAAVAVAAIPLATRGTAVDEAVTYASGVAETRSVQLEDGSIVTLAGASAIAVRFADRARHVRLLRGSAFFDVKPDEARPFRVDAAGAEVTVLGTAFGVRIGANEVSVAVARGVVSVEQAAGDPASGPAARLTAGRRLVADLNGRTLREEDANLQTDLGWVEGYLTYDGAPLSEVVADINRYRVKQVTLEDSQSAALIVTVSFRVDQTDQFLSGLAAAYPVVVEDQPGLTLIRARPRG